MKTTKPLLEPTALALVGAVAIPAIPDSKPPQSELPDEMMSRTLDLELWDLDSQGSFVRKSLPKTSLVPISFSHAGRWGASHQC